MSLKPDHKKADGWSSQGSREILGLVQDCVKVVEAKKGEDILLLDTRKLTLTDYFLIATAQSGRQLKAIADEIELRLKQRGGRIRGVEGTPASGWMLVDAEDFFVHLFLPQTRKYYDLEMLWGDAPRLALEELAATTS